MTKTIEYNDMRLSISVSPEMERIVFGVWCRNLELTYNAQEFAELIYPSISHAADTQ